MPLERAFKGRSVPWLGLWLRDTGVLLASQVMLSTTTTAAMILLSRSLARYDFGLVVSFIGFSQALSFVIDVGLPIWLLREATQAEHEGRGPAESHTRLWHAAYGVGTIGALCAVCVFGAAVALGLAPRLAAALSGFVVYVALLGVASSFETDFRRNRRLRFVVGATLVDKGVFLVGVVVTLIDHWGVVGVAGATAAGGICRVAFDYALTLRRSSVARPRIGRETIRTLRDSIPFAGNTAALLFFPRIDTPLVALISVTGASYFGLGYQIASTALMAPVIASAALLPVLDRGAGRRGLAVKLMIAAGIAFAALGCLLTPAVIPRPFGSKYRPAVPTVEVMWLAMPFICVVYGILPIIYSARRERSVAWALWVPSAVGTGLVLGGMALYGPIGAACGYTARTVIQAIGVLIVMRRQSSSSEPSLGASSTPVVTSHAPSR